MGADVEPLHAIIAETRRHVWAVRPEFWDSFRYVLGRGQLAPIELAAAEQLEAARPTRRRDSRQSRSTVAVIPLQGLITPKPSILSLLFGGGGGLVAFRENLREAVASDEVDAIVLDVDSPGGSTALVRETAAELRAAREVKPLIAVANVDAGSAAYYLAAQASEVVSTPSGMVGSIGTYIMHLDFSAQNEKLGIEPTYISAGRYKTEVTPDTPLTTEGAEYLQEIVDEGQDAFIADVAAGRGVPERTVRSGYGEGRMLTARDALKAGMIDRVETLEQSVGRLLAGETPQLPTAAAADPSVRRALAADDQRLVDSVRSRI